MKATLAVLLAAGSMVVSAAAGADEMALIKKYNCIACHQVDKKVVGPAYKDVAKKYKGHADAAPKLVEKVKKGGAGVWGPIPMPPNPAVPGADLQKMVKWILSL